MIAARMPTNVVILSVFRPMNHASLFSGIGGFDLAASWLGWNNIFQVEIDEFCQKVLTKHFPETQRFRDIKQFDGSQFRGAIGVLSGGFPCQPFSCAGKRRGAEDDRYLWPEMLRVISEIRPRIVIGENVPGIIDMAIEQVCLGLEAENYGWEIFIIPAAAVNAPHRRDRVWIIAHSGSLRFNAGRAEQSLQGIGEHSEIWTNPHTKSTKLPMRQTGQRQIKFWGSSPRSFWESRRPEPVICRVDNGIPNRVDRIRSLGNAIVPQIAYEIFNIIEEWSNQCQSYPDPRP